MRRYTAIIGIILAILIIGSVIFNLMTEVFSLIINTIVIFLVIIIIFSTIVTNLVLKDKHINKTLMKINFKIVSFLFPIITFISSILKIPKNDIRNVYIKLNNKYIYSNSYNLDYEDILILTPHCIQNHKCKLKVTNEIENCKKCGVCSVGELAKLKEEKNVKVCIATGGTLARKIIIDNKPKAVVAVACERDLTSGVQDIKKVPILGIFNKRPNGPCFDTNIDIDEVKKAVDFFVRD
jgi:hypothetical protein